MEVILQTICEWLIFFLVVSSPGAIFFMYRWYWLLRLLNHLVACHNDYSVVFSVIDFFKYFEQFCRWIQSTIICWTSCILPYSYKFPLPSNIPIGNIWTILNLIIRSWDWFDCQVAFWMKEDQCWTPYGIFNSISSFRSFLSKWWIFHHHSEASLLL